MRRLPTACLLVLAACPGKHHNSSPVTHPACATPVRESVLPPDMVQDLGTLQVGTDATFVVTTGTASFFIFSQEVDGSAPDTVFVSEPPDFIGNIPNAVVPTNLVDPDGTPWYDDLDQWSKLSSAIDGSGSTFLAYEVSAQSVSEAFPVPNTSGALAKIASDVGLKTGTWRFTVNDWSSQCPFTGCVDGNTSSRYRVQVVTRAASGQPTLDLEVYLATDPMSPLATALAADAHPQVARWKDGLAHYLLNAGITLGTVHFNDLAQDVKDAYAPNGTVDITDGGPCGNLSQLFTSATVPNRAVHVFLAEEILAPTGSSPDAVVVGVDGSIPGPSGFPGTINGGAIVGLFGEFGHEATKGACGTTAVPNLACGTDILAYIAAHEIGHWLGLYHPTEQDGAFFDPISDTDRCPCSPCGGSSCGTSDAFVLASQCRASSSCGGGANLMFWLLDDFSTGEVSIDQGKIAQLNPAVR